MREGANPDRIATVVARAKAAAPCRRDVAGALFNEHLDLASIRLALGRKDAGGPRDLELAPSSPTAPSAVAPGEASRPSVEPAAATISAAPVVARGRPGRLALIVHLVALTLLAAGLSATVANGPVPPSVVGSEAPATASVPDPTRPAPSPLSLLASMPLPQPDTPMLLGPAATAPANWPQPSMPGYSGRPPGVAAMPPLLRPAKHDSAASRSAGQPGDAPRALLVSMRPAPPPTVAEGPPPRLRASRTMPLAAIVPQVADPLGLDARSPTRLRLPIPALEPRSAPVPPATVAITAAAKPDTLLNAAPPQPRPTPPERPVRDAAAPVAAGGAGPRIVVHYSAARPAPDRGPLIAELGSAGFRRVDWRPVPFAVAASNTRFFHADDGAVAGRVTAALTGAGYIASTRDFTHYAPPPRPGTIEVWIAR